MSAENERHTISLAWNLSHSLEKVWRMLTQPERLARWLMANDMQAGVGQRFTFKQDPTPGHGLTRTGAAEASAREIPRLTERDHRHECAEP